MKKANLVLVIMMLLIGYKSLAEEGQPYAKEKKISNRFTVKQSDQLVIENSYGLVHVNTWDKNEITVDIVITTHASTELKAESMLDKIKINQVEVGGKGRICYKTEVKNIKSDNNEGFSINYTINMPKKNPLDVTNKFGDVYLDDFDGKLTLDVGYGALNVSHITSTDPNIKVAFGSATVSSVETGTFKISYSKLSIDKAGDITIKNSFGKSDIGTVNHLIADQQYGDLDVESVNELEGSVRFADLTVNKLLKSTDLDLKYCGKADFKSVAAGCNLMKIDAHFSSVYLSLASGANFNIDLSTSFGDMKNKQTGAIELTEVQKTEHSNNHHYKGKCGKGEGNMNIATQYGNIVFK